MPNLDLDDGIRLAALIAAIGIAWDTIELTVRRAEVVERFFQWPVVRSRYYILHRHPGAAAVADTLLSGRTFITLVVLHAVAAVAYPVVLPVSTLTAAALAAVVLAVHLGVHIRLLVGLDGADQMQTVVWTGLLVYALDLGPIARVGGVAFIVVQLLLSYVVSGAAKAFSPTWRQGHAIARITRASTYCPPGLSRALQLPRVSFVVGWSIIVLELAIPFALLGGESGLAVFVALGIALHLGIALSMGLSTFVFAFLAAYPVVYSSIR